MVYAVGAAGSDRGWPPEVFVLFETEGEARQHAEKSCYDFDVFPLPVYQSYSECPLPLRLTEARPFWPEKVFREALERALSAELVTTKGQRSKLADRGCRIVWAVGSHEECSPEVNALYASEEDAQQHVDQAYCMSRVFAISIYLTYGDCPLDKRYGEQGPPLSQRVKAK